MMTTKKKENETDEDKKFDLVSLVSLSVWIDGDRVYWVVVQSRKQIARDLWTISIDCLRTKKEQGEIKSYVAFLLSHSLSLKR